MTPPETLSRLRASQLNLDENGVAHTDLAEMCLQTPEGDFEFAFDPGTLEFDDDIGILGIALQSMRNMGQLTEVMIAIHLPGGAVYHLRLSEVKVDN